MPTPSEYKTVQPPSPKGYDGIIGEIVEHLVNPPSPKRYGRTKPG